MSEGIAKTLHDAEGRQEYVERGNRATALAAAIIAVLAALGTLFSHHRSISALTAKSQAILLQARAAERRNAAEAKEIRSELYAALIKAGIAQTADSRQALSSVVDREKGAAASASKEADTFENESLDYDANSDVSMKSYETLQWATAIFEMAIVLVSISTLSRTRALLLTGCGISVFGVVLMIVGLSQGR
ncbi:MAG TPA: DUF4337 family protein [Candidatus Baltobacteraceae bacterium]|jgi:hypothetical protein|nr:DUF4337 family protein [Candidatus Baltobacteraceae bacterium]